MPHKCSRVRSARGPTATSWNTEVLWVFVAIPPLAIRATLLRSARTLFHTHDDHCWRHLSRRNSTCNEGRSLRATRPKAANLLTGLRTYGLCFREIPRSSSSFGAGPSTTISALPSRVSLKPITEPSSPRMPKKAPPLDCGNSEAGGAPPDAILSDRSTRISLINLAPGTVDSPSTLSKSASGSWNRRRFPSEYPYAQRNSSTPLIEGVTTSPLSVVSISFLC